MADAESPRPEEQQTPTKSPFVNVRTDGRAFNSPNWRMKVDSPATPSHTNASPSASPNPTNTSRAAFSRPGAHVPQAINDGRRLYVGNMPYTAKTEDVEALFIAAKFPIERIDIAIDPFTGRNPSYCFVDLQNKEDAERAMTELDGRDMLGRPVKIKPGVAKSQERIQNPPSPFRIDRWRQQEKPSFAKVNSDSSSRVYVGGLPRVTDHAMVQSNIEVFFKSFKVENVSKLFTPHPAKRFDPGEHYYLFVDVGTPEEAQRAMQTLNGREGPWGGPLRVQFARGPKEPEANV
ncbi:Nucleotide-binding alpha-beta plait [Penicillium paradoxum]|uniref:Nucleotide-binding alpha-beta plait n=1 Tax=Penicillium paradoxum TaxID=176176 RepID=UPI002548ECD6|nr:Nucleotide-binding alpha-beta plait [Penicillium paradoxum]KAJ5787010.1 Nucleotide-binding alpha-beta plait [Penicillium paradoxum]